MTSDPATDCVQDLMDKVGSVSDVTGKVFEIYDQGTLLDLSKDLKYPCAGIAYEGMTSIMGDQDTGMRAELTCSIIILAGDKTTESRGKEDKSSITLMLDSIRNAIKLTLAPTGNIWAFIAEIPVDIDKKGLGYYQRWKTIVALA